MPIEPMGTRPDQGPRTETFRERYDEIRSRLTFGDVFAKSKQRADYNHLVAELLDRIKHLEGEVAYRAERWEHWCERADTLGKLLDEALDQLRGLTASMASDSIGRLDFLDLLRDVEQERSSHDG